MKAFFFITLLVTNFFCYSQNKIELTALLDFDETSSFKAINEEGIALFTFKYSESQLCIIQADGTQFILKRNRNLFDESENRIAFLKRKKITFSESNNVFKVENTKNHISFFDDENELATVFYEKNDDNFLNIKMQYNEDDLNAKKLAYFGLSCVISEHYDSSNYLLTSSILGSVLAILVVLAL